MVNILLVKSRYEHPFSFKIFEKGHSYPLYIYNSNMVYRFQTRHVLNFEFPYHIADYVHRCGRTARVGSGGGCHVTSFISYERDIKLLQQIELAIRKLKSLPKIDGNTPKLVERYYQYLQDNKYRSPVRA